jgi:hypothetical protein
LFQFTLRCYHGLCTIMTIISILTFSLLVFSVFIDIFSTLPGLCISGLCFFKSHNLLLGIARINYIYTIPGLIGIDLQYSDYIKSVRIRFLFLMVLLIPVFQYLPLILLMYIKVFQQKRVGGVFLGIYIVTIILWIINPIIFTICSGKIIRIIQPLEWMLKSAIELTGTTSYLLYLLEKRSS